MRLSRSVSTLGRSVGAITAMLAGILIASASAAHTRNDSLGVEASATDLLQVTCFDNGSGAPQSIHLAIVDSSSGAPPQVGVQLQRGDSLVSASDTTDSDASPSPEIGLNGPAGIFTVLVTKTGGGAKTYSLSFHCTTGLDGSGSHAGTSLSVLQNQ